MAAIYKREGSDIWYVDYTYKGRRHRESTKTSDRKLAELHMKDLEVKIARGNLDLPEAVTRAQLAKFKDEYLTYSKANKAHNTLLVDEHAFKVFGNVIGDPVLDSISPRAIEKFKIERLKHVKPSSVNVELKHLKSAFETARRWGYLRSNPFRDVQLLRVKEKEGIAFFQKPEIEELLRVIPEGLFRDLIKFYLYTGCRRNEALYLNRSDIDLDRKEVTFRGTKSGMNRTVPFNGVLSEVLERLPENGEQPFPFLPDFVTHRFKKYVLAMDLPEERKKILCLHSLRHTYASHLVMAGVPLLTVSKLLGHSSVRVTEMYAHLVSDHIRSAVEMLNY